MSALKTTRFERARIIGARALQIGFGAPMLAKSDVPPTDPVGQAEHEVAVGACPITVLDRSGVRR